MGDGNRRGKEEGKKKERSESVRGDDERRAD